MTSPTTSADAVIERNIAYAIAEYKIWGGQLTPDQAMEDSDFRADCYALAEYIAAALTQHAEAGAVAWARALIQGHLDFANADAADWYRAVAIIGEEAMMEMKPNRLLIEVTDARKALDRIASARPAQPASQQGEKVRGLVEKWREKAKRYRAGIPRPAKDAIDRASIAWAAQLDEDADELAAALDQEKNDGR